MNLIFCFLCITFLQFFKLKKKINLALKVIDANKVLYVQLKYVSVQKFHELNPFKILCKVDKQNSQ